MNHISLGEVTAQPGTKKFGYLHVPGAAVERNFVYRPLVGPPRPRSMPIPVMIVNGANEGPKLGILAGTHATEYPSIDAAIRLYTETDPTKLRGALLIIPVLNVAAFWTTTPYLNPQDALDISALYNSEGRSISYLMAHTVRDAFWPKVEHLVELHGGDLMEDVVAHSAFEITGDAKVDKGSQQLAKAYGTEFIFERKGRDVRPSIGRPRIIAEAGREGKLEEEFTNLHLTGLTNIMKKLNMLDGKLKLAKKQTIVHGRYELFAHKAGLFYSKVKPGETVRKGELIAVIKNLEGQLVEEIKATNDGVVQLVMTNPVKLPNDMLYKIWMP
ncbi:MAG: succinylglutamate desuccinylase/aspartoacylase family protein [Candidatus Bathyarchaeia archaeon]|jgi:predicted deacylase